MRIEAQNSVSNYLQVTPIMQSMLANNDQKPKNSLPIDTNGTIQSNNDDLFIEVTLYNAHGILKNTKPNTLLGLA